MLFQRVNRTDAEKVFIIVQNVASATITAAIRSSGTSRQAWTGFGSASPPRPPVAVRGPR